MRNGNIIGLTLTCLIVLALTTPNFAAAEKMHLVSPNGNCEATVEIDQAGIVRYSVAYRGKTILVPSRLGLELRDAVPLTSGFRLIDAQRDSHDETWKPVYGERSQVRDHFQRLVLNLQDAQQPPRKLQLEFRAYDHAVAFCYRIPATETMSRISIKSEQSEFRFSDDHTAWAVYSAQGRYAKSELSRIKPGCERPLTVQIADDVFAAVAEARLVDYARMKLAPLSGVPHALVSNLSSSVEADLPFRTPWRVVMLADSPGELLESNDVLLNLNDPCAIEDTSWIRPGKVIREVTLTTVGGKACVDFAVKHNLQFVEFDAGWYGHEYSDESDATTVTVDPKRSPGPLDLQEVIQYAKERGIGILLYVNRRSLERQLDEVLPLLQSWGVAGVKYGFVNVGSQQWTTWLHDAIRRAAEHRLMVDVHDEYRPTGYSRTYPNFMTQEGIGGDETSPSNEQTLTILFTRMLAGAGDNTICYYDGRVDRNASHAYQLAKAVCIYSPWQFLYWYDRPSPSPQKGGAGNSTRFIGDEPELEFFDHVPTVWDDTQVLHGSIGEYAVITRRSGNQWFLGGMNSEEPRTLDVPLAFLDADRGYTAHIYYDDPSLSTRTKVGIRQQQVTAETVLKLELPARGGIAIRLVPSD